MMAVAHSPVTGLLSFFVTPPLPINSCCTFCASSEAFKTAAMATARSAAKASDDMRDKGDKGETETDEKRR